MTRPIPTFFASPWRSRTPMANQRSKRWAFMERFEVPSFDEPDENYLTRLRFIQTPWFGIYLHRFDNPDSRATFHDHPWPFLSVILRGGYVEARPGRGLRTVRLVNVMRITDVHYIERLLRVPTWSLMFVGRRRRDWGYVRPTEDGYAWTRFDIDEHATEFDEAMAARRGLTNNADDRSET